MLSVTMEQLIFRSSLIIEGTTEKVSQFIESQSIQFATKTSILIQIFWTLY